MPDSPSTTATQKKQSKLHEAFVESTHYFREDKKRLTQPATIAASIAGGVLLSTTALVTPLLGTMIGSGLIMAAGIYLLMETSDVVINNANAMGKKANIAPMALGIGLGVLTSMPELFVSAGAMLAGNPGVGIGNIVGSNIANLALILGGTAAIHKITSKGMSWKFNAAVMCGSTALFGAQMALGALNPVVGGLMLAGLGLYIWKSYHIAQKDMADAKKEAASTTSVSEFEPEKVNEEKLPLTGNMLLGFAGIAGLIGSASLLVASATAFGIAAGVSPVVIGVLAVAVGTSLPEMMVNIKSALKGNTDMAIGNILGSNVFNILMIGGLLSLTGAPMPPDLNPTQTALGLLNTAAFGITALGTGLLMKMTKGSINKKHGIIATGLYAAYTGLTVLFGSAADNPIPAPVADTTPPAVTAPASKIMLPLPPSSPYPTMIFPNR